MTFAQILGHERQKEVLRRALKQDRLAHAYLFSGPEGVGKRLMALALARAVFCLEGTGCGSCVACRKVDHMNHPDLHLVEPDGASIKIDQVRHLQKDLSLRPSEAKRKVCVIDEIDKIGIAAGNALLKTLEEPSGEALFILLTPRPEAVLQTIRSRCQPLAFARLARELMFETLKRQLELDETKAHILTALSDGSFKKALGRDRELFLEKRIELLKSLTALSPRSIIPLFDFAETLSGKESDRATQQEILEIFQAFYRDLLLFRHGRSEEELINIDLMEKIRRVAGRESIPYLLTKIEALENARRQIARNANSQLVMETLLLRLAS